AGAAVALYEEPDVLVKVIRDLFNEDFGQLIVSGDDAWTTINEYVSSVAPELVSKLNKYEPAESAEGVAGPDIFAVHRIDEQLAKAMDRKVWLPSGGTLVIDRTEAMTVVDVNTGKFTGSGGNLEQTVTKNNLEAAEEIVRQLRLRDIGGLVVIDFIDIVLVSNSSADLVRWQPRANRHQEQPGGGRGDRASAAAARHRRPRRHRLHRHCARIQQLCRSGPVATSSKPSPRTTWRRPRRSCVSCGCATSAASSSSTSSTWCSNPTATWCCGGSPRLWPAIAPATRCPR